jgi:hypothetical protein
MKHPFHLLAALMFCVSVLSGAIRAEDAPTTADISNVQAVIAAQMEAFKRDDGEAAFSFAAPAIKEMFHTPEIFMEMVRQQYAPVYRPHYVEYLEPIAVGNKFMQPLILTGENGVTVLARYALSRQASGDWRIIGVTLSPAPNQAPL